MELLVQCVVYAGLHVAIEPRLVSQADAEFWQI